MNEHLYEIIKFLLIFTMGFITALIIKYKEENRK